MAGDAGLTGCRFRSRPPGATKRAKSSSVPGVVAGDARRGAKSPFDAEMSLNTRSAPCGRARGCAHSGPRASTARSRAACPRRRRRSRRPRAPRRAALAVARLGLPHPLGIALRHGLAGAVVAGGIVVARPTVEAPLDRARPRAARARAADHESRQEIACPGAIGRRDEEIDAAQVHARAAERRSVRAFPACHRVRPRSARARRGRARARPRRTPNARPRTCRANRSRSCGHARPRGRVRLPLRRHAKPERGALPACARLHRGPLASASSRRAVMPP